MSVCEAAAPRNYAQGVFLESTNLPSYLPPSRGAQQGTRGSTLHTKAAAPLPAKQAPWAQNKEPHHVFRGPKRGRNYICRFPAASAVTVSTSTVTLEYVKAVVKNKPMAGSISPPHEVSHSTCPSPTIFRLTRAGRTATCS